MIYCKSRAKLPGYIKILLGAGLTRDPGAPHNSQVFKYLHCLDVSVLRRIAIAAVLLRNNLTHFHIAEVGHQIPCPQMGMTPITPFNIHHYDIVRLAIYFGPHSIVIEKVVNHIISGFFLIGGEHAVHLTDFHLASVRLPHDVVLTPIVQLLRPRNNRHDFADLIGHFPTAKTTLLQEIDLFADNIFSVHTRCFYWLYYHISNIRAKKYSSAYQYAIRNRTTPRRLRT